MKTITKEDIIELGKSFDNYVKTAEQYEFITLMLIGIKFNNTRAGIENETYNIEENQKDLRAMFRVVLKAIGKDFSEYLEE